MLIKMMDYCRYINYDGRYFYQSENSLKGWRWDESLVETLRRQFNDDMFPADWAEEFVIRFQTGRKSHIRYAIEYMNDEVFDSNIYLVVHNTETNISECRVASGRLNGSEHLTLQKLIKKLYGMESVLKKMARKTFGMEKSILDTLPTIPLLYEITNGTKKLIPYTAENRDAIMEQVYGSIILGMMQNDLPFEDASCDLVYWLIKTYPEYAKQIAGCDGDAEEVYDALHLQVSEEWSLGDDICHKMFDMYHTITNSPELLFALDYLQ